MSSIYHAHNLRKCSDSCLVKMYSNLKKKANLCKMDIARLSQAIQDKYPTIGKPTKCWRKDLRRQINKWKREKERSECVLARTREHMRNVRGIYYEKPCVS